MHAFLIQAAIFLVAAAFAAPLAKRLQIGSVLGYLFAGMLIGPYGLGRIYPVYSAQSVLEYAELGVVLLLFVIGLEMQPKRLWAMRSAVFGFGALQVVLTAMLLAAGSMLAGLAWQQALYIGLALALSSTAFTLQVLGEKKELSTKHGRLAFAILLFQDLAAIPILALVPILAPVGGAAAGGVSMLAIVKAVAVIALVIFAGRPVLSFIYRRVARTGMHEAMTATALLTVATIAILMEAAGLSAALGAFMAGGLLADSEYRHEVEADIEPFKGLLLGLFFTAIGMSLNLGVVLTMPLTVIGLVLGLALLKSAGFYVVGRGYKLTIAGARRLGFACSQGGEFAFVLLTAASLGGLLSHAIADLTAVVVTLSMMTTPLLLALDDWLLRLNPKPRPVYDAMPEADGHVIIAGFGRVGQVIARVLRAKRIPFTALEVSSEQVDFVRQFGAQIYYGDASRLDILRAAQAAKASAFVLAIDDVEASLKTAEVVRTHFPSLKIYARARNRQHAYRLLDLGVETLERETFESSVLMAKDLLRGLGTRESEVKRVADLFRKVDRKRLMEDYKIRTDVDKLRARALKTAEELEQMFREDAEQLQDQPPRP